MDVLHYLLSDDHDEAHQNTALPDPVWLGARMAKLYADWDRPTGLDLAAITNGFISHLGLTDTPVGCACVQAAAAVTLWGGHAYHSARHHAEVATSAMVMTELAQRCGQATPPRDRGLLLASCLAHDLYYLPRAKRRPRFAAETDAARAMNVIGTRCGLDGEDRRTLKCLILATEPGFRSCLAALPAGGWSADVPRSLSLLTKSPALAALAAVLSDADLLSSTGLTEDWHQVQRERLEREAGRRRTQADDRWFFDTVVGADFLSLGGRLFSPNLRRIRPAMQQSA
jgi:hypothetical protein